MRNKYSVITRTCERKESAMSRTQICISIDEEILLRVRRAAARDDRSVSYMINLFIKNGLKEPKKMRKLLKRNPGRNLHSRSIRGEAWQTHSFVVSALTSIQGTLRKAVYSALKTRTEYAVPFSCTANVLIHCNTWLSLRVNHSCHLKHSTVSQQISL